MSNPLENIVPAQARRYIYAAAFVLSIVATCYEAADGDWERAFVPIITALSSALAGSNVR